jgi:hypothetical protein
MSAKRKDLATMSTLVCLALLEEHSEGSAMDFLRLFKGYEHITSGA